VNNRLLIFWKSAPFIKLLIPFIIGIIIQRYTQIPVAIILTILFTALSVCLLYTFIPLFGKFRLSVINGMAISIVFLSLGNVLTYFNTIQNDRRWFQNYNEPNSVLELHIEEPLVEKQKSWKADATVHRIINNGKSVAVKGKIILYFKKDTALQNITYGSTIFVQKPLQQIKGTGNPGAFDYSQYCLFKGITHQLYINTNEFQLLPSKKANALTQFLFTTRDRVLAIIRKYIPGEKEQGLAEALLIGYKDDLDKNLVQSYSNTGVVHIIAISGLHLGLIYGLLLMLLKPLQKNSRLNLLRVIIIIAGLWLFSLLAGAQPSVLRSALMFSIIAIGESLSRKTNIYNSLALSAFLLLCYNPFWLWDVGFQLSYAAVVSIIVFMKPVYHLFYIQNKIIDTIWKLNAVTLAAQILTIPFILYHFHQFPVYFLFTNLIAVPLSSIILIGEIILCIVAFIPFVAHLLGQLLSWLIFAMNFIVEKTEQLPYSLLQGFQLTIVQTVLIFIFIVFVALWLMKKKNYAISISLAALLSFSVLRSLSFIKAENQSKIIIYSVPQKTAIDLIDGRYYTFLGDSSVLNDASLVNFHLTPSRVLHRISPIQPGQTYPDKYIQFHKKHILIIDKNTRPEKAGAKEKIDILILSRNPRFYITSLAEIAEIKQVVIDSSVPAWKALLWQKDCNSLNIPCHNVNTEGAFVMNL